METVMELEVGPGPDPGSYLVHVLRSVGGGEPVSTFTLDVDELVDRRPQLEESILVSAVLARRVIPSTEAAIQDVGRLLFDALFQGEVHTAYRTSVAVASDRGAAVQLVLRLTAPGLAALPWEALFDSETGAYLCRKEPLVRRVPAGHTPAALEIEPPLRILGMVSSPRGLPALDVEAEQGLLEEALRPQIEAGLVKISWVQPVTWSAVHDRLLSREWHVLHFIGHGTYDTETDEGILAFVGHDGRAHHVPASSLADLIGEAEPSPRLVLLNTCSSGTGGRDDLFSGTAGALAHSGIHAVAAMQFEISDRAAIEFSRGFYSALAHGRRIDDAVRSGRIEILGLGQGTLEWVTPVLYLRGDDTRLFEVAPTAETGVVTADAPLPEPSPKTAPEPVPKPAPEPSPKSAPEHAAPARNPVMHAMDSGDIPVTAIPVIRPGSGGVAPWWTTRSDSTAPRTSPLATALPAPTPSGGTGPPDGSGPSPPPAVRRRSTPRWVPWLVVLGILATIPLASFRPWEPRPRAEFEVDGTTEWRASSVTCETNEEVRMTASGTILQQKDQPLSAAPPHGYTGTEDGYQGSEQIESIDESIDPGALVVGVGPGKGNLIGFSRSNSANYTCPAGGELYFGINDLDVTDNDRSFAVKVW